MVNKKKMYLGTRQFLFFQTESTARFIRHPVRCKLGLDCRQTQTRVYTHRHKAFEGASMLIRFPAEISRSSTFSFFRVRAEARVDDSSCKKIARCLD